MTEAEEKELRDFAEFNRKRADALDRVIKIWQVALYDGVITYLLDNGHPTLAEEMRVDKHKAMDRLNASIGEAMK